ncbi:hypothetical protein CPLU01_05511 [Colletotrichum plurivorum]|uniref:Uncharacterized protein n=1 Tax=Colletotrichum plurivorum TaxID=2175906 RepID=A0A8H6KLI7_9PEZI|nr:hypothetical protein CPLU01_05511 [Colletotrichum plurivorum]
MLTGFDTIEICRNGRHEDNYKLKRALVTPVDNGVDGQGGEKAAKRSSCGEEKAGQTLFLGQVGILRSSVGMVLYLVASACWINHDGFERTVQWQRQHEPTTA